MRKKYKRLTAIIIACVMVLYLMPISALGATSSNSGTGSIEYGQPDTAGSFADVSDDAWYKDYVTKAYELGIVKGVSETSFNPDGNVTIAETITLAARIHNIFNGRRTKFEQSEPWYDVYRHYCIDNGIITADVKANIADYNDNAERSFFSAVITNAIPEHAILAINDMEFLPDVDRSEWWGNNILMLYRAGILTGNDEFGTFNPNTSISRAEMSAVVARIMDPSLRVSFTLKFEKEGRIKTIVAGDPVEIIKYEWEHAINRVVKYKFSPQLIIPLNAVEEYKSLERIPRARENGYIAYIREPNDDFYIDIIAKHFIDIANHEGLGEVGAIEIAMSFVQNLDYIAEPVGKEYPKYPLETLYDNGGDCEDKAILLASLIQAMGYGCVTVMFEDHLGVGLMATPESEGHYYIKDGEYFYYIEQTNPGWYVGDLPDKYKDEVPTLFYVQPELENR